MPTHTRANDERAYSKERATGSDVAILLVAIPPCVIELPSYVENRGKWKERESFCAALHKGIF